MKNRNVPFVFMAFLLICTIYPVQAQQVAESIDLDEQVKAFLQAHKKNWRDMNVPETDGKVLYELIISNNYKSALEVGTSTGRSTIWIAWALSKTGGKLITIELNKGRYEKARENIAKAGLSDFVDFRLANAHELVPLLEGPFDFVFLDADKAWYTKYLQYLLPKLNEGGCFTAHNVLNSGMYGIKEFLAYVENLPELETTINQQSRSGISISYKKSENNK